MTPAIDLLKKIKFLLLSILTIMTLTIRILAMKPLKNLGLIRTNPLKHFLVAENGDQKKLACFVLSTANMLSFKKAAKSIGVKRLKWPIKMQHKSTDI